jgi:5'-methylthioadenosine phosphorylase
MTTAEIGILGGSGLYSLLTDADQVSVQTPYGDPSDALVVGDLGGRTVAFLPRHGRDHRFPPHLVNYRANLWALRSVGVTQVLAPNAVGSLQPSIAPGTLVVPDQLIDRTSGRPQTFYTGPAVVHVGFADPYCPRLRTAAVATAGAAGWDVNDGGTLVVIEGPRFSTRAESQWFAGNGWSVVGMTGHPEAVLARELALCYASLSLVTDHDAGVETGQAVSHAEVLAVFGRNVDRMRGLLADLVAALPAGRSCGCAAALDDFDLPAGAP